MGFQAITLNNPDNVAAGEAQLSVEIVAGVQAGTIDFTFYNAAGVSSVITEILFEDLTGLFDFTGVAGTTYQDTGVWFEGSAKDGNLMGNQFVVTSWLDATNPSPVWGINEGEQLSMSLVLASDKTFEDVMEVMSTDPAGFRIGLHVQSIGEDEGSEKFVNTPPGGGGEVPEPFTVGLLGMGLAAFAGSRLRSRKNQG
jgi:hypothetical protein